MRVLGSEVPHLPRFQLKCHSLVDWGDGLAELRKLQAVITRDIESLEEQVHSVHRNSVWLQTYAEHCLSELILRDFAFSVVFHQDTKSIMEVVLFEVLHELDLHCLQLSGHI